MRQYNEYKLVFLGSIQPFYDSDKERVYRDLNYLKRKMLENGFERFIYEQQLDEPAKIDICKFFNAEFKSGDLWTPIFYLIGDLDLLDEHKNEVALFYVV